jgi:hypothetical protein
MALGKSGMEILIMEEDSYATYILGLSMLEI